MAERVECELAGCLEVRELHGLAEVIADGAVVESAADCVGEDEVARGFVVAGEPACAEALGERRGEDDVAFAGWRFESAVGATAGELAVDVDQSRVVVEVAR